MAMQRIIPVLAVFLVIAHGLSPIWGQATDHGTNKAHQPASDAQGGNRPASSAPPAAPQIDSPNLKKDSSSNQPEDAHQSVAITKLVPVSVDRDWIDYVALSFSGILVLVGIGGVIYARRTLTSIRDQLTEIKGAGEQTNKIIGHAESQASALLTVAEASAKAANAAHASAEAYQFAERAWMALTEVTVHDITNARAGQSPELLNGKMFVCKWINAGHTPAINCSILAMREISVSEGVPAFTPPPPNVEQMLAPIPPSISVSSEGVFFREDELDALKSRKVRFFLYSRADYDAVYPTKARPHSELCMEVIYRGTNNQTGEMVFSFRAQGQQNSAT